MKLKVLEETGIRIDKYLALNTDYSREYISKLIEANYILVNGSAVKSSYKVKENDEILINDELKKDTTLKEEDISLDIVYEDDDLLVINKPSGLVVHPGNGNHEHTMVNALLHHTKDLSDNFGVERAGIVHRLDKDTSGLMIAVKTNKAHEILADDFKNKRVKREYLALIHGVFPSASAKIDAPIGRSKKDFRKMEVVKDGKKAVTNLKVVKRYKKYTLVRLSLETGRTHQIRCHMEYIGYPVFNDPVYSKDKATSFGQFLHSASLDFIHPITKEKMHFEADIPLEFKEFLINLEKEI